MEADIAHPIRRMIPRNMLLNGIRGQKKKLHISLIDAMTGKDNNFNKELSGSIVNELAGNLNQMAKVAEIPIE